MNKLIITSFFICLGIVLLSLNLLSAEQMTLGTFKIGSCINLKQTCSNCTYNNISSIMVTGDNNQQVLSQTNMTKSGTEYYYNFCNATVIGHYIVNGFGDLDGQTTVWAYDFNITSTGKDNSILIPTFILIAAFLLFSIALYQKNPYIGFFAGCLALIAGLYIYIYGFAIINDDYSRMFGMVILCSGLAIIFTAMIEMFYWGGDDEAE